MSHSKTSRLNAAKLGFRHLCVSFPLVRHSRVGGKNPVITRTPLVSRLLGNDLCGSNSQLRFVLLGRSDRFDRLESLQACPTNGSSEPYRQNGSSDSGERKTLALSFLPFKESFDASIETRLVCIRSKTNRFCSDFNWIDTPPLTMADTDPLDSL